MILEDGKFEGKNITQKELDELGPFVEGTFDSMMSYYESKEKMAVMHNLVEAAGKVLDIEKGPIVLKAQILSETFRVIGKLVEESI